MIDNLKKLIKKTFIITALVAPALVSAQEIISVYWGFNMGSSSANSVRLICDELNKMQNKYQFVFVGKPGAGGSIAANTVLENSNNSLVAMSSSFIIRPYLEKKETVHDLDKFTPILVQGTGSPLFIGSSKFNTLNEAINGKNVNIGVSGVGTISHLIAHNIFRSNATSNIIFFRSSLDAAVAAAGGHVDVVVAWQADMSELVEAGKLKILGKTGPSSDIKGVQDINKLAANYAIYASTSMDKVKYQEIHNLMIQANVRKTVEESYKKDLLNPVNLSLSQYQAWYNNERAFWQKQVDNLVKK